MKYSANKQSLLCDHCGHTKALPRERDQIVERPLTESFALLRARNVGFGIETTVYHCNDCGADVSVDQEQVSFSCPFCASTNVNEAAQSTRVIQPSGILPFSVPKKKAQEQFSAWIGTGWFRPNNLKKLAALDKLQGVYIPFWTFDAMTRSTWTAQAGYHYYVPVSYTDKDGNRQTRQELRIRWENANGYYERFFDDVLIIASDGLSQGEVQSIYPYDLDEVINYDSHYVLGWECELYQKDVKEGFQMADKLMDSEIRHACSSRVPGDTHKDLRVNTQKDGLTFKHILLPIWIAAYVYNGKVFRFIVNGVTGKISGHKPVSWSKILLFVLFIVGLVLGAVFLSRYLN